MTKSRRSKVTMTDVAAHSGVSPATVSLVLRNKPGVGAETRQRVLDSAQTLGYVLRPSARSQSDEVRTAGLIVKVRADDIPADNSFYAPVLAAIEAECRRNQFNLLLANMPVDESNTPLEIPRLLRDDQVDGVMLVGVQVTEEMLAILAAQQTTAVLVDAYAPEAEFDAVVSDNVGGAREAVGHLVALGHRRIALVGSTPDAYPSIRDRRAGYVAELDAHGLTPLFADSPLLPEAAAEATLHLLETEPDVTAVFACNDNVAIAAMQAIQATGRRVPEDVALIGFDNIALAQHVAPPLTTMRVDKVGMGRLAMQLLINRLTYPEAGFVQSVIHPQLIERGSTRSG